MNEISSSIKKKTRLTELHLGRVLRDVQCAAAPIETKRPGALLRILGAVGCRLPDPSKMLHWCLILLCNAERAIHVIARLALW
jgi:hypothetical protein